MEDSYTVHRRRKAAARKREKTPEPPRRRHEDDLDETDDDDDRRARMERMVQETEMLEVLADNERRNEKSRDASAENTTTPNREERNHRILKRPVTPEVRGETDENVEVVDGKLCVEVSKRNEKTERGLVEEKRTSGEEKSTSGKEKRTSGEEKRTSGEEKRTSGEEKRTSGEEKRTSGEEKPTSGEEKPTSGEEKRTSGEEKRTSVEEKRISGEEKKTSGEASPEVEYRRDETTPRKSRKDGTGSSARSPAKRRPAKDSSPEVREKSVVDGFKNEETRNAASKRVDETRDVVDDHAGKTSTRKVEAMIRDENRLREAAENAAALRSPSGKNLRNDETRKNEKVDTTKSRNSSTKRTSKDTRSGYTTDSSENEETLERKLRRKKSPETGKSKLGAKKSVSRSRPTTDTDGDPEDRDLRRKSEKRTASSRRRASTETDEDTKDRGSAKRDFPRPPPRQTEKKHDKIKSTIAMDDPVSTISRSDTFPPDNIGNDRSPKQLGRSSTMDIKKQIIPLSDDSLIEDFERAQLDYLKRERSILDPDPLDDYVNPRIEIAFRRRKMSIAKEEEKVPPVQPGEKKSWFSWIPFFGKRKKEKIDDQELTEETTLLNIKKDHPLDEAKIQDEKPKKKTSLILFFGKFGNCAAEFRAFAEQNPKETRRIRVLRNRCLTELLVAMIYCGLGAFVFRFTEGAFETFYKCGVKRVKRDFLDSLWNFSHNMREEDWKSMARRKLMEFEEQLHTAHEAGVHSYSGQKSWSFLNAVLYCLTVITTIGYGHISPSTTTGRAITIVYAIFGIPMFLIILADFGKLFTRGIKFLWAFVRRVYYTGSCRRVRRTVPVQEVMKGVQLVYDLATFRRPSQMNPEDIEEMEKQQNQTQTVLNLDGNAPASAQPDTPGTPALSTFAIDDEFNLPISVAIVILLAYIFVGATVYNFWEQWGFFESFYFVFISMSTIGFGDYVPKHPIYMMLSIVYLVFGLALTSMCINVVQVMLSDSFRQASQKIGATIGFEVAEEDDSANPEVPSQPVEIADVHPTIKESESEEHVAPKAKQEDLEF